MARWNDLPWREEVCAAADIWKERCLLNDGALFSDDSIWTATNLSTLQDLVISNADPGSGNFRDKLFQQLSGASSNTVQLAAELMWLIYLFPLGQQVEQVTPSTKASTKSQKVNEILKWGGLPTPTGEVVTVNALSGIGRTGRYYTRYWHALQYMLEIFIAWKGLPYERKVELLEEQNAWEFAKWSDHFEQQTQVPFRHALLFFLFPDNFERMVSFSHKKEIARGINQYMSQQAKERFVISGDFGSFLSIDRAIFEIRQNLEHEGSGKPFDFYTKFLNDDATHKHEMEVISEKEALSKIRQKVGDVGPSSADNAPLSLEELQEIKPKRRTEGQKRLVTHYIRERSPALRRHKIQQMLNEHNVLQCECCGTKAEEYAHERRHRIFEVHHKRPLSDGMTISGIDDLSLLCAHCHKGIHASDPLKSVDEFRDEYQCKD